MTLESESLTPYPHNAIDTSKTAPVMDINDNIEATEKLLED